MLASTVELLNAARTGHYAIGAFNIYNLEGVQAVVLAAEQMHSPAMLQILPGTLKEGGAALVAACLAAAQEARVPIAVHLDHSSSPADMERALHLGIESIMVDGSAFTYAENVAFTARLAKQLSEKNPRVVIEGELGRISGSEGELSVSEFESKLTDPAQAHDFVQRTDIDALAVCIGNVHGRYPTEPRLDFDRLIAIRNVVDVPLVLHGASGLLAAAISRTIELGICKFNVNTELREAYLNKIKMLCSNAHTPDLVELMREATGAMQQVVVEKLALFGSAAR